MNWKKRLTNYNFWISIISAVLLILQAFDISFDIAYINEIVTAVLGLLVVIGIINDPTKTGKDASSSSVLNSEKANEIAQENDSEKLEENTTENDSEKVQENFKENESDQVEISKDNSPSIIKAETNEIDIPIQEENENNIADSKNDYEILVNKIYSDMNEMKINLQKLYSDRESQIDEKIFKNTENDMNFQEKTGENTQNLKIFDNFTEKNENSSTNKNDEKIESVEQIDENNISSSGDENIINESIVSKNTSSSLAENSNIQTAFKIVND